MIREQPSSDRFNRFDRYAPFVEILNVYRNEREFFHLTNWSSLVSRAKARPLLPNLKKLSIITKHERAKVSDIPMWIKTFATSTTVEVSTSIPNYFWPDDIWAMTYASASETLDAIVKSCPNIQRLSFCPHKSPDSFWPDPRRPRNNASPKLWFDYLAELPSLRHLEVTNGWFTYISLIALGRLTTLESLNIHIGDFEGFGYGVPPVIDSNMPEDVFLSLRKLTLSRVTGYRIDKFDPIPKLVRNITILEVMILREEEEFIELPPGLTVTSVFPWLEHAPHLKTLRSFCRLEEEGPYVFDSPEDLDVMARVPLQTVHLEGVSLGKGSLAFDLGVIWPNVTELIMPHQFASLQELSYFAAIPNLTRLRLKLRLNTTYNPDNIPTSNHAPLRTLESSDWDKLAKTMKGMKHNARVLKLLWPQLREVTWHSGTSGFWYRGGHHSSPVRTFNQLLNYQALAGSAEETTGQMGSDEDEEEEEEEEEDEEDEEDEEGGWRTVGGAFW